MKFLPRDQGTYQCSALVQSQSGSSLTQIYSNVAKIEHAYLQNEFTLSPDSKSGKIGSKIQLQCVSPESHPLAVIHWERNDQRISGFPNGTLQVGNSRLVTSTLEISSVNISTVGFYRCVAENKMISQRVAKSSAALIKIEADQEMPYFVQRPRSIVATRHRQVVWPCVILGEPQPVVIWYKNDQLIHNTSDRYILGTGSLVFKSISENDAGSYSCKGTNKLGSISLPAPVALVVAFIDYAFLENPSSAVVIVGKEVNLGCKPPKSYPDKVAIFWYFRYHLMTFDDRVRMLTDGTLRIAKVNKSDEGTYFCAAENEITKERRSSRKAILTVQVTPFIEPLVNETVARGANVTLRCQASGSPLPIVNWFKENVLISSNATLTITSANISDIGWYTCQASNAAGKSSQSLYLNIQSIPKLLTKMVNFTKMVNDSIFIPCQFSGFPKPKITWFFMSKGSPQQGSLPMRANVGQSGVRIASLRETDEGIYICIGVNSAGKAEGRAYIEVQVPPIVVLGLRNKTAKRMDSVIFKCNITGDPQPSISWLKDGQLLTGNTRVVLTSTSLSIRDLNPSDSGWYECKGTSRLGSVSSRGHLGVQVPPSPPIITNIKPLSATSLEIFWVSGFNGYSPILSHTLEIQRAFLTAQWKVYDSKISAEKTRYLLTGLQPFTVYRFRLTSVNGVGRSSYSQLKSNRTLEAAPSVPLSLQAKVLNATAVEISWKEPVEKHGQIVLYQIIYGVADKPAPKTFNVTVSQSISYSLILDALLPNRKYYFNVRAATGGNGIIIFGNVSQTVYATTPEAAPYGAPMIRALKAISSTSISVEFDEVDPDKANGVILGYRIHYVVVETNKTMEVMSVGNQWIIKNLMKHTLYSVSVQAFTKVGSGPPSQTVSVRTKQDVPGPVSNVVLRSYGNNKINVSWSPPLEINGILTAYIVKYNSESGDLSNTSTVLPNKTKFTVDELMEGVVYIVVVAAQTGAGMGPFSEPQKLLLGTKLPQSTAAPFSSPNPAVTTPTNKATPTEPPPKKTDKSTDLLDSKNLPIVLAVIGVLFILIVSVLILAIIVCRWRKTEKKNNAKDERDGHWINTRSFHGGENPAYRFDQFGFELNRTNFSEVSTLDGRPTSPSTFDPGYSKPKLDEDLIWEDNDSDRYAVADDKQRNIVEADLNGDGFAENDSVLMKLKTKEAELGEDANYYDKPYSTVRELGEPFAKDLFSYLDSEDLDAASNPSREPVSPGDSDCSSDLDRAFEKPGFASKEEDLLFLDDENLGGELPLDTMSTTSDSTKTIPRIELPGDDMVPDKILVAPKIAIDPGQQTYNYEKGTVVMNEDAVVVFDEHTKL